MNLDFWFNQDRLLTGPVWEIIRAKAAIAGDEISLENKRPDMKIEQSKPGEHGAFYTKIVTMRI